MRACVIVGHGSVRSASGASMVRIAARLRERGLVELAEAGFLNYSRPTMAEAIDKCVTAGATQIVIQPYFLIDGYYVRTDLPALLAEARGRHPAVDFAVAEPFSSHPALVELVCKRLAAVDPALGAGEPGSALLLMAHGTPLEEANAPIAANAAAIEARTDYAAVHVAYLDCNSPTIPAALDELAAAGFTRIVTLPYFLHVGRHVAEDLPRMLAEAATRWPDVTITAADHLGYDLLLVDLIAARMTAATADSGSLYPITLTALLAMDVLVVGGGPVAERKVRSLLAAGAAVRLISPTATPALRAWAAAGRVTWQARTYETRDIGDALLVFAATNVRDVNAAVARDAQVARRLCNVADAPHDGSFHVPAVAWTDEAIVAVSTRAGNPRRAQEVRDAIAKMLTAP